MHGKGVYTDSDGVIWNGIFKYGKFETKDQKALQIEIAIKDKIERIKASVSQFFQEFIDTFTNSDKKALRENMIQFFASEEKVIEFLDEPYTKFDEKPFDKWNEAMILIKENTTKKIKVLQSNTESSYIAPEKIKANQFSEKEGQIVEILIERENDETLKMSLIKGKEGKWLMAFFEDNFPEFAVHKKK